MEKLAIERSIWIAAPRERVWQAVTDPEQLAQWFLPPTLGAQMKRDDRGKISVCMGDMEIPIAIFDVVDPPRQVIIRSLPDRLIAATYTLEEEKGGTRVTVTMSGFESLPEDARQERLGPSGTGWAKALENLKAYIDGTELPFPQGYVAALFGYRREAKEKFAVDPPHQLVTRSEPEPPETPHVTAYTLEEENGGTRLTLIYSGYELEPDDRRWNNMEQNAFGFGMMLENLQAHIEGKSLPYPGGF